MRDLTHPFAATQGRPHRAQRALTEPDIIDSPAQRPFSAACERNRDPILDVLRSHLGAARSVLEVGSGSGQHAIHFAARLPGLVWQCSDRDDQLAGIRLWLDEAALPNTPAPVALDVARQPWFADDRHFDAVFSANTLHIMGWPEVGAFFQGMERVLRPGGTLVVYGPFNYGGRYTSASNQDFDHWLQTRDPRSGIRDFEAVDALARQAGLILAADVEMPANNRCLVWRRIPAGDP